MLTLLAGALPAVLGLLASAIPQLVGWLEKGQQFKHEIELTKLRMEAMAQGLDGQIFLETVKASAEEGKSVREHDLNIPSNKYIDILRASVRPLITYSFFIAFVGLKITLAVIMLWQGTDPAEILNVVWDNYTNAIFGCIVGFWFGSRSMLHMAGKVKA